MTNIDFDRNQPKEIKNALLFWKEHLLYGFDKGRSMPPENYFEMSLEALVADPQTELDRVCEFLGLSFYPRMLTVDLGKGHVGRWKEQFTTEDIDFCKRECGDLLIELGYEKDLNW
jgi:hypothetical protein